MSETTTTNDNTSPSLSPSNERIIGQVKWFNNKAGYGFITVTGSGPYSGKDIFVHYTTISVGDTQYKYLVQGEYVEFQLSISTNTTHEYQATHISGINGGMLMCETRQTFRGQRKEVSYASTTINNNAGRRPPPSSRLVEKPVSVDMDGFKTVTKKRSSTAKA
jgi:cold shock CspA family protein